MEVCMKCQQSGINYLKESTIYPKDVLNEWSDTLANLSTIFSRGFYCVIFLCMLRVLPQCGPSLGTSLITVLARLRPYPGADPIPSQYSQYFPWPFPPLPLSPLPSSWARSSQLSHSLSQHGVTGREWTHTQSNVCPLSKSQHWETFNIHNLSFREIQNILSIVTIHPHLQSKRAHRKPILRAEIDSLNNENQHCIYLNV